jgi:hypothetical protein
VARAPTASTRSIPPAARCSRRSRCRVRQTVGGAYLPGGDTVVTVQWIDPDSIRVIRSAQGEVIAEFSPGTGFDLFYGDTDVDHATGHLFLVSSPQTFLRELAPADGAVLAEWPLDIAGMSGLAVDDARNVLWISSTDGVIHRVRIVDAAPDGDADGAVDIRDNCTLVANADQRDTDGDGFGNRCDADFDGDCTINFVDLGVVKSAFFGSDPDADLDGDGSVNFLDLAMFKAQFFGVPGPSGRSPQCVPVHSSGSFALPGTWPFDLDEGAVSNAGFDPPVDVWHDKQTDTEGYFRSINGDGMAVFGATQPSRAEPGHDSFLHAGRPRHHRHRHVDVRRHGSRTNLALSDHGRRPAAARLGAQLHDRVHELVAPSGTPQPVARLTRGVVVMRHHLRAAGRRAPAHQTEGVALFPGDCAACGDTCGAPSGGGRRDSPRLGRSPPGELGRSRRR